MVHFMSLLLLSSPFESLFNLAFLPNSEKKNLYYSSLTCIETSSQMSSKLGVLIVCVIFLVKQHIQQV